MMCYEECSTERETLHHQQTFAEIPFEQYRKSTRRERFLDEMNRVVPWAELVAVIKPVYPKADGPGVRRSESTHAAPRLQQWFNLSDPAVEEALYDSRAMRQFVGIDLGREPVPDETTICKFRHVLEAHELGTQLFIRIGEYLTKQGLQVSQAPSWMRPSSVRRVRRKTGPRRGSRDASNEEGEPVVFRYEGAYWRGQPDEADSFRSGHGGQCP